MALRQLACPNRCADERFEALNAPLLVDASGTYLEHDDRQATFVCAVCSAVAVDLGAAAREMTAETDAVSQTLVCPGCGLVMLPPEDEPLAALVECPVCRQRFSLEEGMPRLHGGSLGDDDAEGY